MLDDVFNYAKPGGQTSQCSSGKLAAFHFKVPRSISNFTGREIYLQQLVQSLGKKFCLTVVSGMGGVGKTCLIRHFVNKKEVKDWNILWLATETVQDLQNSLNEAANYVAELLPGK